MQNNPSFLGTGWGFPPTFTGNGAGVDMVSGTEDIQESLHILLATGLGERVMHEDYGCELSSVLFEEMDQGLVNTLNGVVSDAILYHEPRIRLEGLDVSEDPHQPGLLLISIEYTVASTNSRFNMVYPFYINEAATPG